MKRKFFGYFAAGTLSVALCFGCMQLAMAASSSQVSVYNTIYGTSLTAAEIDAFILPFDEIWEEFNGGATAEEKSASYTQTFGFYTDLGTGSVRTNLFTNIAADGYLNIGPIGFDPNVQFGFFTDPSGSGPFFSETVLNADNNYDHFRTYSTPVAGEFIIFTEDLYGGGDEDFVDLVVSVKHAAPVPEPSTMLLIGTGLAGLAGFKRRFKK